MKTYFNKWYKNGLKIDRNSEEYERQIAIYAWNAALGNCRVMMGHYHIDDRDFKRAIKSLKYK